MEEKFSNHTPTGPPRARTGQPGCMLAAALAKKPQLYIAASRRVGIQRMSFAANARFDLQRVRLYIYQSLK